MIDTAGAQNWTRTRAVLTIAVVLLSALLIGLLVFFFRLLEPQKFDYTPADSTEMRWVRSLYGFGPSADEQLKSPSSVAIAPNGDIYVTEPVRSRVMVFRPDGTFRTLLHTGAGGAGAGEFARPESIDIAENGEVYIADSWAAKIIVFDADGEFLREWPVEEQARGVAVVEDRVYVLDVGRVLVYDTRGEQLASFGTRGPGTGQIDAYQGITARDGQVYIADSFNKRLQSYTESGTLTWAMPDAAAARSGPSNVATTTGDGSGSGAVSDYRWDLPQDVIFDGSGRLIVIDAFRFEIAVVDPETGVVQASYGEFGRLDGQFFYPTSIAYDAERDWFAVADTQNNRVQIVRIPGSASSVVAPVWRAASSPYRHLLIPALLIVSAVLISFVTGRRLVRRARAAVEAAPRD